jgi:predicted CoA-binding protein
MNHQLKYIKDKGYKVVQMSPYHYHVKGKKTYINVWPTSRKWMIAFGSGASVYQNKEALLGIIQNILGMPESLEPRNPRWLLDQLIAERDSKLTEEDRQAYIIWRDDVDCLQGEISGMIEDRKG